MFITINIIFLYTFCIESPLEDNINLREDCYRSFSDPVIFIKLQHYHPSGPIALRAEFMYERYSLLGGLTPERIIGQYQFSRYDFPCNTSTIFTTGGIFFKNMLVNIKIYLLSKKSLLANIRYIFERSFKPGEYKLHDLCRDFAVQLKIFDTKKNFLETQKKLTEIFKYFIESISDTKGELCIITDNNRAAVIKLKNGNDLNVGYVFGFYACDSRNIDNQMCMLYPAFLCQTHGKYYEEKVIFVTEKNTIGKRFYISYLTNYIKDEADYKNMEIEFENTNFEPFDKYENISYIYNKIFLIPHYGLFSKNCSDGSKVMVFYSEDKIELFAKLQKIVKIATGIEAYTRFPTSLSDPCGEEEQRISIV